MVEFPLGAVGVQGTYGLAGGNSRDLYIERMTFIDIHGVGLAAESYRKALEDAAKLFLR